MGAVGRPDFRGLSGRADHARGWSAPCSSRFTLMNRSHMLTAFGVVAVVLLHSARASAEDVPPSSPAAPHLEVTIVCSGHASCSPDIHLDGGRRPAPATTPPFVPLAAPELPPLTPPVPRRLRGPVDSPDGFSLVAGGFYTTFPKQLLSISTAYVGAQSGQLTIDDAHAEGAVLSLGGDSEHSSARLDIGFGTGSYSGSLPATSVGGAKSLPSSRAASSSAVGVDGDLVATTIAFRLGARLPSRYVAFAAGGGLGASVSFFNDLRVSSAPNVSAGTVMEPSAIWDVPLWASVDLKPACDWGIEIGASYNLQPLNTDESTVSVQAGVLFQPASACSQEKSPASS